MEQQNNKEEILRSIRKHKEGFSDSTTESQTRQPVSGLLPDELKDVFVQSLKTAGANVLEVKKEMLEASMEYAGSCSLEELDKIEKLVLQGNFGVAENGAIWIEDKDLPHRLLPFITQHLILQMDARKILPTMQEAYRRIDLKETGFGVFISGPSKTADIEQSLVYGAHGAKELTVLLVSD